MFVNVRKMVSIFESKKQPRPLSLPPCEQTHRENEKPSLTSEPRPSLLSPAPSTVIHRPRPRAGERVRRVRDSWPTGKIDYYPRANRLAVSMETKEPIRSKDSPRLPSKNTISGLRTSSKQERMCSSKPSFTSCTETHIAPPAGQISLSSCVSDRKCQNPVWSSLRAERGGADTHTRKPRPSDSTLFSLLLFFHR